MCGWPLGKPRKPKENLSLQEIGNALKNRSNQEDSGGLPKGSSQEPTQNSSLAVSEENQSSDDSGFMPFGDEKIFGVKVEFDLRSVAVCRRRLYKRETHTQYPSKVKGEGMIDRTYRQGEYGDWEMSTKTWHPTIEFAIDHIRKTMRKMKLLEANSMENYLQIVKDVEKELSAHLGLLKGKK